MYTLLYNILYYVGMYFSKLVLFIKINDKEKNHYTKNKAKYL